MSIDDGGSAFPLWEGPEHEDYSDELKAFYMAGGSTPGMTLRDWFAGMALAGYLAGPHVERSDNMEQVVMGMYDIADAMIAWKRTRKAAP